MANTESMKKVIALLEGQKEALDSKAFELEAWKSATIIIMERLYGENSQKIRQIEKIAYDYSSWSMRDTSGFNYIDACKNAGRQILDATIREIEALGLPKKNEAAFGLEILMTAMEDVLSLSEFREIRKILHEPLEADARKTRLADKLKIMGVEVSPRILANILTHPSIIEEF